MKKLLTMLTSLTLMGLAGVAPAQAAIVAGWNSFNAATASYPKAADTVGANITSTGLDTAGIDRRVQSFVLGSTVSTSPGRWNGNSTVNTGQYVEFAVQPSAGFQVDFTDLQLNARQDETQLDLVLRSSVDGFTNNLGTQVSLTNSFNTYSFDLSSLAPLDLMSCSLLITPLMSLGVGLWLLMGISLLLQRFQPQNLVV